MSEEAQDITSGNLEQRMVYEDFAISGPLASAAYVAMRRLVATGAQPLHVQWPIIVVVVTVDREIRPAAFGARIGLGQSAQFKGMFYAFVRPLHPATRVDHIGWHPMLLWMSCMVSL
jgi:hypothetical protein